MSAPTITRQEWRWVMLTSLLLVLLTIVPYLVVMATLDTGDWQFMGVLANPKDSATYLSKIDTGSDGHWRYELHHSPQDHPPAWVFGFYVTLGQIDRLIGVGPVGIFQASRLLSSLFMFCSLYWLGSRLWADVTDRRRFLLIAGLASGLGWLAVGLFDYGDALPPDLAVPEAFPLYAAYTNPHFPLSLGCLALSAGILLPHFTTASLVPPPGLKNGGAALVGCTLVNAVIAPPALVALGLTLGLIALWGWWQRGRFPRNQVLWGLGLVLPGLPVWGYYYYVFTELDFWTQFNAQNVTPSPPLVYTLAAYGVLLVVAAPCIVHTVRTSHAPDRFMLLWFGLGFIAVYTPYALQRRFLVSLILPLTYFAVQSLRTFWSSRLPKRWQPLAVGLTVLLILPSHLIAFVAPLAVTLGDPPDAQESGLILPRGYDVVFTWLADNAPPEAVVLAAPGVGRWLPVYTPQRVVFGHEFESVPADALQQQVQDFYTGTDCGLVTGQAQGFVVDYVLWGAAEQRYVDRTNRGQSIEGGTTPCLDQVRAAVPPGDVVTVEGIRIYPLSAAVRDQLGQ